MFWGRNKLLSVCLWKCVQPVIGRLKNDRQFKKCKGQPDCLSIFPNIHKHMPKSSDALQNPAETNLLCTVFFGRLGHNYLEFLVIWETLILYWKFPSILKHVTKKIFPTISAICPPIFGESIIYTSGIQHQSTFLY